MNGQNSPSRTSRPPPEPCEASTTAFRGPRGSAETPQQVWLTADPSGQHLLISYGVDGGFTIGWIAGGALHRLPIIWPYLPNNATLIIAW